MRSGDEVQVPRRVAWPAYVSGAFGLAITAQINFLVPLRAHELGASLDRIGIIVAAGAAAPAVLSVPLGSLIDRIGPRRSFMLGTGAAAVASVVFVAVTNYWWLLALQPVLGASRNLGWVASQSYITSLGVGERRASMTGRFSSFSSVGQMAGPVLVGGVAQIVGFRFGFLFTAAYAAGFFTLGTFLTETSGTGSGGTGRRQGLSLRSIAGLIAVRGMQVGLMLTFVRLWVTWVFATFFAVYLVESGLQPGLVGVVMATSGLVATLLAPTAGIWTRFVREETVTILALSCGAAGLFLAPHVSTVPFVFIVPACNGVGLGLSLPLLLSIVTGAVPEEKRGMALGLRAMANQSAAAAAPVAVGPVIAGLGALLGFTFGGLFAGLMLFGCLLLQLVGRRVSDAEVIEDESPSVST